MRINNKTIISLVENGTEALTITSEIECVSFAGLLLKEKVTIPEKFILRLFLMYFARIDLLAKGMNGLSDLDQSISSLRLGGEVGFPSLVGSECPNGVSLQMGRKQ